jgi:GMP synthase-like glutamine amidotransferase
MERLFLADGFTIDSINAQSDRLPDSIEQFAGIVLLGGPMAVYDDFSYLVEEQALVRKAIKSGIPLLGVCLGSQLIAQATGGRVYKGLKKEIGWHDVSLTLAGSSDVFRGLGSQVRVFQWHGDTYDLPPDAAVLARSEFYPQAFRVGSAIGIQFHLEVDNALIERWTQEYKAELEREDLQMDDVLPRPGDINALEQKCVQVYGNFSRLIKERQ